MTSWFSLKNRSWMLIAVVLMLLFQTCTGPREIRDISPLNTGNCQQQTSVSYINYELPAELNRGKIPAAVKEHFSLNSLHVAHAIGIMPFLEELITAKYNLSENQNLEMRLHLLETTQKINNKIQLASLEISAVASEMDCEEERAEQIANYLKQREDRQSSRLTVAAIGVGAIGAIVTGVLLINGQTGKIPEIIGLTTGFTEATLGYLILRNGRVVQFQHKRNPLKEIWEGRETSTIFPPSLWYYLNRTIAETGSSHRQQLINNWIQFAGLSPSDSPDIEEIDPVFFGEGGLYTADQLFHRANMLDQTEAQVSLMKQDLSQLSRELYELSLQ
ncbi:MAG: hypothetical protein JJU28_23180 [Cyclobacteriaceae bacterium]|nr:hypothetical protein [Cyclobacteriaceae bacterium]